MQKSFLATEETLCQTTTTTKKSKVIQACWVKKTFKSIQSVKRFTVQSIVKIIIWKVVPEEVQNVAKKVQIIFPKIALIIYFTLTQVIQLFWDDNTGKQGGPKPHCEFPVCNSGKEVGDHPFTMPANFTQFSTKFAPIPLLSKWMVHNNRTPSQKGTNELKKN